MPVHVHHSKRDHRAILKHRVLGIHEMPAWQTVLAHECLCTCHVNSARGPFKSFFGDVPLLEHGLERRVRDLASQVSEDWRVTTLHDVLASLSVETSEIRVSLLGEGVLDRTKQYARLAREFDRCDLSAACADSVREVD